MEGPAFKEGSLCQGYVTCRILRVGPPWMLCLGTFLVSPEPSACSLFLLGEGKEETPGWGFQSPIP